MSVLREITRRFIGDRLTTNIKDEDLLEVLENHYSYIHSDILIPIEYINLYEGHEYLRDVLESDTDLFSKIILLNNMLDTMHFMYKWATYKINPKFKCNMYETLCKNDIVTEHNNKIRAEDYALSIKFLVGQEYLNDIIDEYCKSKQYYELMLLLKDSCTNKVYREVLSILSTVYEVTKYNPTLNCHNGKLDFLFTLVYMCGLCDMKINFIGLELSLKEWSNILLIDRTLVEKFMKNLIDNYYV